MSSVMVLLSFFCGMLLYTSCADDLCENTLCINGDCDEVTGNCICDEGWEGIDCSIPICWENSTYNETTELCECDPGWTGADCLEDACGPNGTYNATTGSCDCDPGYTGADCSELTVSNFTGSYFVNETCEGEVASYTSDIGAGSTESEVLITNFWGLFENVVVATVNGNELIIPAQEPDGDGFLAQGNGLINDDGTILTINFLITDVTVSPADVQDCQAIYNKQ